MFLRELDIDQIKLGSFFICNGRYSESLYALLSFGGLYYFVSGGNNKAILLLALSGCARSNGVLNAGYLCFQTMHRAYHAIFQKKRVAVRALLLSTFLHDGICGCSVFL